MCDHPPLISLPFELKLAIFSYLDINSIFALSSVSQVFNNVSMCDEFYQFAIEKDCIILKHSTNVRSDFLKYLEHHLGHVSWKLLYKQLVVLPYLERKFISLLDFTWFWKQEEEFEYIPRIIRLEAIMWLITSKYYAISTSIQELEDIIILGHHCFSTLSQFFVLLMIKYCVPTFSADQVPSEDTATSELARNRVCEILSKWIERNKHDILLNRSLCTIIRQFITYTVAQNHKQILDGALDTISVLNIQKHIEHLSQSNVTIPSATSTASNNHEPTGITYSTPPRFQSSVSRTSSNSSLINNNNAFNDNIQTHQRNDSGHSNITINTKIEDEDDIPYEAQNINEFNKLNPSLFGSAGTISYPPMFSMSLENVNLNILECSLDVLAVDIAWLDWELYYRIRVSEIMDKSWRHANKLQFSPNIVASIKWFNHISFWVATEVLDFPKIKQRAQAISNFIQLALKCYDLRDFHSVFSILAGLNMACIHRLKNTWEIVSKKLKESFAKLSRFITGVNGDFLAYKTTLKNSSLPAVPYLGCLLNDITFVLDTSENPKFPLIYLHKIVVMSKIVNEVIRYQQVPYNFTKHEYSYQIMNVKALDAGDLYRKSLELEPKLPLRTASLS